MTVVVQGVENRDELQGERIPCRAKSNPDGILIAGVIPMRPRFFQRAEGSPLAHGLVTGDPSLRRKGGSAQDDSGVMGD